LGAGKNIQNQKAFEIKKKKRRKPTSQKITITVITCLHDQNKSGFFWRAGFYSANQNNLKCFQKALIGWKKAGPPKKPLSF